MQARKHLGGIGLCLHAERRIQEEAGRGHTDSGGEKTTKGRSECVNEASERSLCITVSNILSFLTETTSFEEFRAALCMLDKTCLPSPTHPIGVMIYLCLGVLGIQQFTKKTCCNDPDVEVCRISNLPILIPPRPVSLCF